jgi:hypothetical protein
LRHCEAGLGAKLAAYSPPQVPTMLLNRLSNFSFLPPPASQGAGGPTAGSAGAASAQTAAGTAADASAAKRAGAPAAPPSAATVPKANAPEGVLLTLDSARKPSGAGTYTQNGLFADAPRTTALTPAEEFVAAAVVNIRNYDQARLNAANDAAAKAAQAAQHSRFDGIKQAVSRLYASA